LGSLKIILYIVGAAVLIYAFSVMRSSVQKFAVFLVLFASFVFYVAYKAATEGPT